MKSKLFVSFLVLLMFFAIGGIALAQLAAPNNINPAHRASVDGEAITFRWTPVEGAARYQLRVIKISGVREVVYSRNVRNVMSHTPPVAFPEDGSEYFFQVRAGEQGVRGWGNNPFSTRHLFTSGNLPAPDVLFPLPRSEVDGASITFQWRTVPDARRYRLIVRNVETGEFLHRSSVGNRTSYTVSGFPQDGTNYFWRVFAINLGGRGKASAAPRFTSVNEGETPAVIYDRSRKVEEMVEAFDPTVLNLTDARGNRYTLHIPLEANLFGNDVGMVAVQSIEDFPMSGGLLGGVGLLPDGLVLIKPATLVVKPADSSAVNEWLQSSSDHRLLGYTHTEDGGCFHYYPYTVHGDEIHFSVPCFRGFGLGLATGDDITQHLASPAMTASIEANRAAAPVFGDLAARRLLANPSASFSDAEKTALTQVYNRWFDQRVAPLCTDGEADVESLDQAIIEYLQWVAAVTKSGTDHTQRNRQALNTIERGMSNYLLMVQSSAWGARKISLPVASSQDQSQLEQGRMEFHASFAGHNGLDILDRILEKMKRRPRFILESTITWNEGTEDEIRVSVKSDPVFLSWTKIIHHVPRLATMVGTAAIRHTDYYIWAEEEECYNVIYNLTPGTINVELFPARGTWIARPEGGPPIPIFLSNEEWVQRSFAVIKIMPLQSSITIIDICGDPPDPPRTTPTAPVWLGGFSVFHQDKFFSEGMLFRNWQYAPQPPPGGPGATLEFNQVGQYGVVENTTMRYYWP